jgi:Rieske 2Fe-2S family protein
VFVSLSDSPLDLGEVEPSLAAGLGKFDWATAKVAHQESYVMAANWKLALENQVECYHCLPSHPEFSKVHAMGRVGSEGAATTVHDKWVMKSVDRMENAFWSTNAMVDSSVTASKDGKPVSRLMGRAAYDGMFNIAYVGVLNHLAAYADYGAIFKYTPLSVQQTDLTITWLVHKDAQPGRDYDLEELIWMWKVTATADKRIVQENQKGVSSRNYQTGPYILPIESKSMRFTNWYLERLRSALPLQ